MIKVKYNIDRGSELENADYDLSDFASITICFDTNGNLLSISHVNDKIAIGNKVVIVDVEQKVEDNVPEYER